MTSWATRAHARVDLLTDRVSALEARNRCALERAGVNRPALEQGLEELGGWHRELDERRVALRSRSWWDGLKGDKVEDAWGELHRIEEGVDGYEPLPTLLQLADEHIAANLAAARAGELRQTLGSQKTRPEDRRATALRAIREAHNAEAERHASERNWQRGLLLISGGALLAGPLLVLVQALLPDTDTLLPPPQDGSGTEPAVLLALVLALGVVGGALGALVSQYRIYQTRQVVLSTLWFDPMPALTTAKMAMGMWTAFLGVLMVGTGALVGGYSSVASLLLLAFAFGYGQQALTRVLDEKVAAMLKAKERPTGRRRPGRNH